MKFNGSLNNNQIAMGSAKIRGGMFLVIMLVFAACSSKKAIVVKTDTKAAMMANTMAHLESKQLYSFITDWTGVKYRLGGMDKKGIDCSGFALLLEREIYGKELPRRSRDKADLIREKNLTMLKEGDLIFFSFAGGAVDHVGVYLNNNFFVHASTTRGVIVDDLSLPAYQKALIKAGSFKD